MSRSQRLRRPSRSRKNLLSDQTRQFLIRRRPCVTKVKSQIAADVPAPEQSAPPPPPPKPEWIEPDIFVNDLIPVPLTLHSLYTVVESKFRDSEYGERAAALKRGLIAYRDESLDAARARDLAV